MTFSAKVKQELKEIELLSACCVHAQGYGLFLFGKSFDASLVSLTSEDESLAQYYADYAKQQFGTLLAVKKNSAKKFTAATQTAADSETIFSAFGHSAGDTNLRINRANLADSCCCGAFLRGAFLACGTISTPQKHYHLELVVPYKRLSMDLMKLMQELELQPKYINRKGYHVVYLKDSEEIEDMLTAIGATNASLELMGVKIHKDMRNRVNRRLNFETANIGRTVDAARAQTQAIRKIEAHGGLGSLPEPLRELAQIRAENPEASLRELSELLCAPISRSGVNHRLNKIIEFAENIK